MCACVYAAYNAEVEFENTGRKYGFSPSKLPVPSAAHNSFFSLFICSWAETVILVICVIDPYCEVISITCTVLCVYYAIMHDQSMS